MRNHLFYWLWKPIGATKKKLECLHVTVFTCYSVTLLHPPPTLWCGEQVQEQFAHCALDVKSVFDGSDQGNHRLEWSNSSLSHVATLLLRAHKTHDAW